MTPLARKIVQTADIPSIPHVLQQILSLADNPKTTSTDLEKIVMQEPALSSQLLKWVNSAYYALPQRVSSISHAMILLGFSTVKSIASGMILIDAFDELTGLTKEYVLTIWRHTLTAANIMKVVSTRESTQKRDELFLAAMIHDVGYLLMKQYYQAAYDKLLAKGSFPTCEDERAAFGIDHAEIGGALLNEWKFPELVIELVRSHHSEPAEAIRQDLQYLKLCDHLAYQQDMQAFLDRTEADLDAEATQLMRLTGWSWDAICAHRGNILRAIEVIDQLFK